MVVRKKTQVVLQASTESGCCYPLSQSSVSHSAICSYTQHFFLDFDSCYYRIDLTLSIKTNCRCQCLLFYFQRFSSYLWVVLRALEFGLPVFKSKWRMHEREKEKKRQIELVIRAYVKMWYGYDFKTITLLGEANHHTNHIEYSLEIVNKFYFIIRK